MDSARIAQVKWFCKMMDLAKLALLQNFTTLKPKNVLNVHFLRFTWMDSANNAQLLLCLKMVNANHVLTKKSTNMANAKPAMRANTLQMVNALIACTQ